MAQNLENLGRGLTCHWVNPPVVEAYFKNMNMPTESRSQTLPLWGKYEPPNRVQENVYFYSRFNSVQLSTNPGMALEGMERYMR